MFINKQFILSSSSKSRKKILKNLNLNFKTIKPSCNEAYYKNKMKKINFSPKKISLELSKIKARSISIKKQNKLVIGLDTVISFNGKLLEKAKNMDEAKRRTAQLKEYSDDIYDINKHCEERLSFYLEKTEEFNEAQMNMIAQYVDYDGE